MRSVRDSMGNTACCQTEAIDGSEPPVDAKPILDSTSPGNTLAGGDTEQERLYEVTLVKTDGSKLGLDVDYMAERKVLPIMHVTGGVAEEWNRRNPMKKMHSGDCILEVNGITGNVAEILEKCKADSVLNMKLCRCLTYEYLLEDLEKLIRHKNCGPILIRLSWHDAGVFNGVDGCPNAAMRLKDSAEHKMDANAGLPQIALSLLGPIAAKYVPRLISHADLWVVAANVAIKTMGGPTITTRYGRVDAVSASESASSASGRLPEADKDEHHLRSIFHPKGFEDKEIVALCGAHSVGSCHLERSGYDGAWTDNKLKFDNSYFKDLLHKQWQEETNSKGKKQFRCGSAMMLPSDMALLKDPSLKRYVLEFAEDENLWFSEFGKAWIRLQEAGCQELRDIL